MDIKKIKKDVTEFYGALNEFFDWCDQKEGVVGEYPAFEDGTLLPADREAEMIPTLNDKEEIYRALYGGTPFNVEILYGDLLRQAFSMEHSFRYDGNYVVTPMKCSNFWKSGFDIVENGEVINTYSLDDFYESDYQKLIKTFDWEALAAQIMDDLSDYEEA